MNESAHYGRDCRASGEQGMTKFGCMLLLLALAASLGVPSQATAFRPASDSGTVICTLDVCHMSDPAVHGSSDLPVVIDCADALSRSVTAEEPVGPDEPLRRFIIAFLKDHPPNSS